MNLKIAQGTYKAAKDMGILIPVSFFYALKVDIAGGFIFFDQIPELSKLGYGSTKGIKNNFTKLFKLGFITRTKQGYRLCSKDRAFELLGFDMKDRKGYSGRDRKGTFKVYCIPLRKVKLELKKMRMREYLAWLDAGDNIRTQVKTIRNKDRKERTQPNIHISINRKLNLTVRSLAKMLSVSNATAWRLFKKWESVRLISYTGDWKSIGCLFKLGYESLGDAFEKIDHSRFMIHDLWIFARVPNKITLI